MSPSSSAIRFSRLAAMLAVDRAPLRAQMLHSAYICRQTYRHQPSRAATTATEYKSYTLDPPPTPPRNKGIPDTSIAGPGSQESPALKPVKGGQTVTLSESTSSQAATSIPEQEAQKSKPVLDATAKTLKPSKLRPRKAAIILTSSAISQLRALLNQPDPKFIRVGVKNRGCSGLAYSLDYVDKPGRFDETVEQEDVKVLVDSKALFSIIGSEMDWIEDKLEQRFVFRNPNIKEQCGCGESFMV